MAPPNTQYGILGNRLGFRLNYQGALTKARTTWATFLLDGLPVKVRYQSVTIHDVINDAPNTCALTIDARTPPTVGQRLTVRINTDAPRTLFAGPIQTVGLTYEGKPNQTVYPCQAIDDTPVANRKLPYGQWVNTSATTIGQWLVTTFCPANYSSAGVQAGLPAVSVNFDSTEGMDGCLRQLAKLIGGYFYWDDRTLHLFVGGEPGDTPDPIDASHPFLNDPPISVSTDSSQVRTRVYGKGYAESIIADVAANDTILPISNAVMFNPAGGQAVTETQRLRYTGTDPGGGGTVVGPGISPTAAPTLALASGAGVTPGGTHDYAVTFTTAAGESLIGPRATINVTGPLVPPVAVTSYGAVAGVGLTPGTYLYATTFVTATGETTPSPTLSIAIGGPCRMQLFDVPVGPVAVTARKVYRTVVNGSQLKLVGTIADNTTVYFLDAVVDGSLGANAPAVNTATVAQVAVSGIPLGAATVTGRKLYRSAVNATALKLLATLGDNTTTIYTDAIADASLGAAPPAGDTSGLQQTPGTVLAGAPSMVVAGAGWARAAGGWAVIGNGAQTIRYTTISGNTLMGIPPTGPGAITASISFGSTISAAALLLGVTGLLRALIKGAPLNLWVQRDDLTAQASITATDGTDGVIEHLITDERRGETSLTQLCAADLAQYSTPIQTVPYATRDVKSKSGKPVTINLTTPAIHTTLTIQDVTITEINLAAGTNPRFTVTASSVRFSLEDMLRRLGASLDVTS